MEYPLRFRFILSYFLNYFIFHVIKGIKNGCPCIVQIRGTLGCVLATSLYPPTARAGFPTKTSYQIRKIAGYASTGNVFPLPRLSDLDMHHGTCMTHVPWCMPGSLTSGILWSRWRGNVPGIPSACATHDFTYLVRDPYTNKMGTTNDSCTVMMCAKNVAIW